MVLPPHRSVTGGTWGAEVPREVQKLTGHPYAASSKIQGGWGSGWWGKAAVSQ